jgi:hypothetical protein
MALPVAMNVDLGRVRTGGEYTPLRLRRAAVKSVKYVRKEHVTSTGIFLITLKKKEREKWEERLQKIFIGPALLNKL